MEVVLVLVFIDSRLQVMATSSRDQNTWNIFFSRIRILNNNLAIIKQWSNNNQTILFKSWKLIYTKHLNGIEKNLIKLECKNIWYSQYTIYVNHPIKTHKGDFATSQGGLAGLRLLRSDGSLDSETGGWTLWPKALKTKLAQGRPSGSSPLRSDGSRDGHARDWTSWVMAKDVQGRVGKQL
jgi:hypothetical protein